MKRVPVFAHTGGAKVARGHMDFFNEETFQKFVQDGGSIVVRWEGGDVGLVVEPASTPSSDPTHPQE